MKLTLGFSPCPNDTFIFDALVNQKIDTAGFDFDVVLADVETLNHQALAGKLDITKLSFPAFFQSLSHYSLLTAGAAIGKGVGPLLISKKSAQIDLPAINQSTIALPGENTTANFLFSFAFPQAQRKIFMQFDKIENYTVENPDDLGVIIHENRFTYQQKGLVKVADLGEVWEQKTGLPIPLGGIAIRKTLEKTIAPKINILIRQSIENAFARYPVVSNYVKEHSQTMQEAVMRQHIELYVNNFSLELGHGGKSAIENLYTIFSKLQPVNSRPLNSLFIEN